MIRYAATSMVGVVGTVVILVFLDHVMGVRATKANLTATMIMSIPSFLLNKYWVWGNSGRARVRREVLPFWVFTVAGWALSTGMVYLVDRNTDEGTVLKAIAVPAASIAGFGILWVLKYAFLDKIMFGTDHHTPYDEEYEIEEAVLEAAEAGEA